MKLKMIFLNNKELYQMVKDFFEKLDKPIRHKDYYQYFKTIGYDIGRYRLKKMLLEMIREDIIILTPTLIIPKKVLIELEKKKKKKRL
jgi:hypothetical protein